MKAAAFILCLAAAACAQIQPVVAPGSPADPSSAYITGTFTRASARGFAFAIRNQDGREYFMSLGDARGAPGAVEEQTIAIQVPPGTYGVWHWVAYEPSTRAVEIRRPVDNPVLAKAFTVRAGEVVHLGEFDVEQGRRGDTSYYSIKPAYIATREEARGSVAKAYPNLAGRPFRCLVCR
jgi:hypothetical protein